MRGEQLEMSNSRDINFQIFNSLQILNFNTKAAKIRLKKKHSPPVVPGLFKLVTKTAYVQIHK